MYFLWWSHSYHPISYHMILKLSQNFDFATIQALNICFHYSIFPTSTSFSSTLIFPCFFSPVSGILSSSSKQTPHLMMMMMVMNCFCGMVGRQKAFSLISSRDHGQRFSLSRISDTPRAGFEPA